MICKKCGAKNSDARKRCFHCGNILIDLSKIENEFREERYDDFPDDTKDFQKDNYEDTPSSQSVDLNKISDNHSDSLDFSKNQNFIVEPVVKEKLSTVVTEEKIENDSDVEINTSYDIDDGTDSDNTDIKEDLILNNQEPSFNDTDVLYDDELSDEDYEIYEEIKAEKRIEAEKATQSVADEIKALELDESTEQHFKTATTKQHTGIGFIIWILVLLFIVVSVFMGILIYNYINTDDGKSVDPTTDTLSDLGIESPVVTKHIDSNEKEYLHAIFKGTPGDRIYLECNNSYHTFIEETLEIDLYLEDLFSSEYEFRQNTVEANMHAYYVRGSKKYSCQSPYVKMSVPLAEIDLSALPAQNIKVYSDTYNLKFWTSTDSLVLLDGENITSSMSGTGSFNYEISVPENSSTTHYLTISQPYHLSKTEVFILSRDLLPVTLVISSNNEESQSDATITLKCQTEENTSLTSNLPILSLEWNDLYSTADITLDLSSCEYGEIKALITATNSKGSSTKSHTFIYWPDENSITTKSDKFTSAVATNCASYVDKNYVISSVKATKNSSANRFEGTANLNGVDYNLIFDITDISSNVIIGNNYKIFAKCTGKVENGRPLFRVWFIYKG